MNKRNSALIAATLFMLTACGTGDDAPAGDGATGVEGDDDPLTTYSIQEVADAACGDKKFDLAAPDEQDFFTAEQGSCGKATLATFNGPSGLNDYLAFFDDNTVLRGKNWIVWIDSFDPEKVYAPIMEEIGGEIGPPAMEEERE